MTKNSGARVAVLMGSTSDEKVMQACLDTLEFFKIPFEKHILSAHRNPEEIQAFCRGVDDNNIRVIITGAGMAAHLPGVLASLTTVPVIGVPLEGSALGGQDALYSMVQMPSGVPVATVAIGQAGAKNSAVLAAQILALNDAALKERVIAFRKGGSRL